MNASAHGNRGRLSSGRRSASRPATGLLARAASLILGVVLATTFGSVHAAATVADGEYLLFHHHDALGSTVATTDEAGRVLWHENSTPYGASLGRTSVEGKPLDRPDVLGDDAKARTWRDADRPPLSYTGHTRDGGSGLVYMQARHYDPALGRFLSNDPVGFTTGNPVSFNRYAYANNNPYSYVDPDGREARLQAHHVAFGANHSKIALIPDNQSRYAQDPRFSNTLPDGRRYATVGAGPVDGKLVSGKDRKRDVRQDVNNFDERLNDGSGRTDDELMEALLQAESNFDSDRNYDTFPGIQPGYNSNSFISGLLNFLNLSAPDTPSRTPGFDKPVPPEDFEPEQGP